LDKQFKLGYFVENYATFIVNEILELRKLGVGVAVFNAFRPPVESDPMKESLRRESRYFPPKYRGVLSALLFCLLRSPKKIFKLARFLRREKESLRMLVLAAYYSQTIRKEGIQHLHGTFGTRTTTLAYVTADLSGIDYSFTTHAYDIFDPNPSIVWKTNEARFMRTISAFNKKYIEETYKGVDGSRIQVAYLGVDTKNFASVPDKTIVNRVMRISSVGNLILKKGHQYLAQACEILKKRGIAFECDIIGEGYLHQTLSEEIAQRGITDCVRLLGNQDSLVVKQNLTDADIFALPCIDACDLGENLDGIPVALMEAMALGLPVISTPLSGIPELIEDGVSGLLVPEKNEIALADALERLIKDADLRNSLGRAARCRVEERFDINKNTLNLLELFQQESVRN
jgi:glycosyltransferase involved in cell wall biosynthesis